MEPSSLHSTQTRDFPNFISLNASLNYCKDKFFSILYVHSVSFFSSILFPSSIIFTFGLNTFQSNFCIILLMLLYFSAITIPQYSSNYISLSFIFYHLLSLLSFSTIFAHSFSFLQPLLSLPFPPSWMLFFCIICSLLKPDKSLVLTFNNFFDPLVPSQGSLSLPFIICCSTNILELAEGISL